MVRRNDVHPDQTIIRCPSRTRLNEMVMGSYLSKSDVWVESDSFYGEGEAPGARLIIGFDTEFKSPDTNLTRDQVAAGDAKYEVLSYQVWCHLFDPDKPSRPEWGGVFCPEASKRHTLGELIAYAVWSGVARGVVKKVPRDMILVGHFTRADMPALFDRNSLTLEAVRSTFVTMKERIELQFEPEGVEPPVQVSVAVRDTMLLTAAGAKSLRDLGNIVGEPKVVLSSDPVEEKRLKENMDEVLRTDPDLFERYALTDAKICVRYYTKMMALCEELIGTPNVPVTLTGIALDMLLQRWKKAGRDPWLMVGKEEVKEKKYDNKRKRYIQTKKPVPLREVHLHEAMATEAYHGGRGEQFWFGPAFEDDWTDYDLSGAYPTAMALIRTADWRKTRVSTNLNDYTPETLGVADVTFKFPKGTRFPTMPVRTENGLIFPLAGTTSCAAPEIALARSLGARIRINHGVIVPYADEARIFGDFIKDCVAKRRSYPKKSLEELFWKEASNSTYGKTAQGLREKRVYSMSDMDTKPLEPSRITNPFFAAYITSFVRAVLGEILNALPPSVCVFSCTTDGFLSNATAEEMEAATSGPICKLFGKSREWLTGEFSVVEIKHKCRRPLGWRTRGQATLKPGECDDPGMNIVLAKGGIHAPPIYDTNAEQNQWITDLFFERRHDTTLSISTLTGVRDIVEHDADLVSKETTRRLGMEFDWKRRPRAVKDAVVGNRVHVAFSTDPWDSPDQFVAVREHQAALADGERRCMKSVDDFAHFANGLLAKTSLTGAAATYLKSENPDIQRLRKMLCQARAQHLGGLSSVNCGTSARHFADILTHIGVPCKRSDVENGAKSQFIPHACPPTVAVKTALLKLKRRFPDLQIDLFLANSEDAIDLSKALKGKCDFVKRL